MRTLRLALLCASALATNSDRASALQIAGNVPEIRWEPYSTQGVDDRPLAGELGRIRVPEDRSRPEGRSIEIAFVRFRTANPEPGPPVFYLVGGPGPSGIEHCVGPATGRMLRLLDRHDVIGIDQRGTGSSRPNLAEGPTFSSDLPMDRAVTREQVIAAYSKAVERCVAHWRAQGVDLSAYNTIESADDIDDVRRALGIYRILTWGESYGTHLSLAYLRRHAAHVARSVLIRVEGPDHTWKLPSTTQRHLERLGELVAADAAAAKKLPDFLGTVRKLLDQLAREPAQVAVELDGVEAAVVLGPYDLQSYLANSLGQMFQMRDVPAAVHAMTKGDWSALGEFALETRRGEIGSAMALMMDCSSNASAARLRRIEKERLDPANCLSDAVNVPYPGACKACGDPDLGDAFRGALECSVPVLFVSGDLDARTPPENVDEILSGFPNRACVLVRNAGHESLEMMSADYRALLQAFLRGEKVADRTIDLPAPRFRFAD
jgi:pimeloyl-ACP methyl ester carboxylesterase